MRDEIFEWLFKRTVQDLDELVNVAPTMGQMEDLKGVRRAFLKLRPWAEPAGFDLGWQIMAQRLDSGMKNAPEPVQNTPNPFENVTSWEGLKETLAQEIARAREAERPVETKTPPLTPEFWENEKENAGWDRGDEVPPDDDQGEEAADIEKLAKDAAWANAIERCKPPTPPTCCDYHNKLGYNNGGWCNVKYEPERVSRNAPPEAPAEKQYTIWDIQNAENLSFFWKNYAERIAARLETPEKAPRSGADTPISEEVSEKLENEEDLMKTGPSAANLERARIFVGPCVGMDSYGNMRAAEEPVREAAVLKIAKLWDEKDAINANWRTPTPTPITETDADAVTWRAPVSPVEVLSNTAPVKIESVFGFIGTWKMRGGDIAVVTEHKFRDGSLYWEGHIPKILEWAIWNDEGNFIRSLAEIPLGHYDLMTRVREGKDYK